MENISIIMALMDFVPVILFAISAIMLQQDLYNKMTRTIYSLFSMGTLNIVFAGFSKALYKLLYAANICDFKTLSNIFFPLQSIGFLMAGIAAVAIVTQKQKVSALYSAAPPLFTGTLIFVTFMCVGLGMLYYGLSIIAIRLKKTWVVSILIFSFTASLCMGYLSSKNFELAYINWIAEFTNTFGQGLLLVSTIMLRKAGLAKFNL